MICTHITNSLYITAPAWKIRKRLVHEAMLFPVSELHPLPPIPSNISLPPPSCLCLPKGSNFRAAKVEAGTCLPDPPNTAWTAGICASECQQGHSASASAPSSPAHSINTCIACSQCRRARLPSTAPSSLITICTISTGL